MKTQTLTIQVAPEDARAYETAAPEIRREIDDFLRRKLSEAVRQSAERQPLLAEEVGPDAAVDKILELLSEDRYQTARKTAAEAVDRFPDHSRVQEAWGIFDVGGKATVAADGPQPSRRPEFDWLRHAPEALRGHWVALVGSELVGSAATLEELTKSLNGRVFSRTPLVHRVD